jgi:hypothetical protein
LTVSPSRIVSKDPAPPPSPFRWLSADDKVRVVDKLRRLETAAMFRDGWNELQPQLDRWMFSVRGGMLPSEDVPRIAEALRAWGVQ